MPLSNFFVQGFDSVERVLRACSGPAMLQTAWLRRALPQSCALCIAPCGDALLCPDCRVALPALGPACPVCALPSPQAAVCGACLRRAPPFDATIAAWRYAFPVDRLLHAFKYGGHLALAEPLAEGLAGAVACHDSEVDSIVALPLAAARQRERGFNQAHEIAKRIARRTKRTLLPALARVRDGVPQAALPWRERARQVRNAFAATHRIDDRRIALVDDVMTTGATLAAAAKALRLAGAARIELWVVARTLPIGQDGA